MRDPHEEAICELANFCVNEVIEKRYTNHALETKVRADFEKRYEELEALVGPLLRDRFRQKVDELIKPKTIWGWLQAKLSSFLSPSR
jgi:hypothetical protein